MGGSPGDVSEEPVTHEKRKKGWRMSRDVGEQSSFSNLSVTSPTSQLILQPFRRFTYVTAHSAALPSLYLRHTSFSNQSVASPTSQLILQPFFRFSYVRMNRALLILQPFRHFTYVTAHFPALPLLHLHHSSFSNPSFASPTSQGLHLIHLASRQWYRDL